LLFNIFDFVREVLFMHKLSKGKFFLMFATVLMLAACIQESENDRIPVRYTVLVRDGKTGKALEGASVELTGEDLVARTLTTNENGAPSAVRNEKM